MTPGLGSQQMLHGWRPATLRLGAGWGGKDYVRRLMAFIDGLEPRPVVRLVWRYRVAVLLATLAVVYANEVLLFGPNVLRWDVMFASGYTALVVGIALAQSLQPRLFGMVERLARRGALVLSAEGLSVLLGNLETRASAWSHRGGLLLSAVILVAYVWAIRLPALSQEIPETLVALVAGYIAGRIISRMVCYGFVGAFLRSGGAVLKVQPGHPDGAAGLKPLGDFYFFQAMLIAIPPAFVAVWTLLIPIWPYHDYSRWREPYIGLLVVALIVEIGGFVLPMWAVHRDMARQKAGLLARADQLGQEIVALRAELTDGGAAEQREATKERLELLTRQYQEIEELPTWPIDQRTRRRFTLNNLAMFLPLAAQLIGATAPWQRLADGLGRFLAQPP